MSDPIKNTVDTAVDTAKQFIPSGMGGEQESHKDQQSKDPAHPFSERETAGATALSGEDDSTSQQSKDKQDEATASAKETVQLAKEVTADHSSSGGQKS